MFFSIYLLIGWEIKELSEIRFDILHDSSEIQFDILPDRILTWTR